MAKILLCDDTQADLDLLQGILAPRYGRDMLCAFERPEAALDYAQNGGPFDVALLDILMPGMTGTALAAALRKIGFRGQIIFLTASNHFAAESYGVGAFDYLLKPVDARRVNEVFDRLDAERSKADNAGFTVTVDRASRRVLFRDLLYTEAQGRRMRLCMADGSELRPYMTTRDCARLLLEDDRFAFSHHSFIVNLDQVRSVTGSDALLFTGGIVPISRRYGNEFRTKYLARTMGRGG